MADLEDGYTRLANSLLEAAISHSMTLRQLRVFLAVVRKTFGFNKAADRVSGSQLAELTGLSRQHCSTALSELVEMKVITRSKPTSPVSINRHLDEWCSLPEKSTPEKAKSKQSQNGTTSKKSPKSGLKESQIRTVASPKSGHTKDTLKNNSKDIELANANSCPEAEPSGPPPVAWLPTNKSGEQYDITQVQIDEWSEAYPAVDVLGHIRRMYSWLNANPRLRKTKRGMPRFIVNWLSKEQDRGHPGMAASTNRRPVNVNDELAQMQRATADIPTPSDDMVI
ncbi:replication protein [Pseudoalteromonas rubra]|uniref:replication protein n=1 Tax=Pseudoalteromonas rubra TaxID=43658 RepID=UPI00197F2D93|nr:replication protein [Pseudoalteromonas rubra]